MENQSNEFINGFVSLFQQALSNNNAIREKAIEEIEHFLEPSNILTIIEACVSIIMSDTVPITSQSYSFVILCNIFRPTSKMLYENIKEQYQNLPEQMKVNIRTAFLRGLLFSQPEIYNQAAFLVSLIVVIDDSSPTIIDLLKVLRDLAHNPEHPETAHYASMIAFREIYRSGHLNELQIKCQENFEEFLNQQKEDYIEFLKFGYEYPVDFITEVVKTLSEMIVNCSEIFDNNETINVLYEIFEMMLPQVFDEALFKNIFILLYGLVKKLYNSPGNLNMERVIVLTSNGLSCNNPYFVSVLIDFWFSIAYIEKDICVNNNIVEKFLRTVNSIKGITQPDYEKDSVRKKEYHGYSISFVKHSISEILNILTKVDLDDVSVENMTFKQPYMYVVGLLSKIFYMEPYELFNQINNLYQDSVNSDVWTIQHAFLKALVCLCSNLNYDYVEDLFKRSTNFIIKCTQSEIDRLSAAAVNTLQMIAKYYVIYSNEVAIPQMLEVIKTLISRNQSICSLSLQLLQNIVSHEQASSAIDELFDDLILITSSALDREDYQSREIFVSVFNVFKAIVQFSTENSVENVKNFLKNSILTYLKDVVSEIQSQEISHMMEQNLFQTIIVIFKKFKNFLNDEGIETIELLLNILNNVNGELFFEDILLAISHIIPSIDTEIIDQLLSKLMSYIESALTSKSPSIIKNSIMIIENFFSVSPTLMLDQLPFIIDLILNCLKNQDFTPDFFPEVAKNLSYIIKAISNPELDFFNAEIRDKTFEIYRSMSSLPLDFSDDNGNEFANLVLEATFLGFARIISFSAKETESEFLSDKNVVRSFFQPAVLFQNFKELNRIKDTTLMAFLEMIYVAMLNLPKNRFNALIRRRCHFKLIILAMVWGKKQLNEKAIHVWNLYITN